MTMHTDRFESFGPGPWHDGPNHLAFEHAGMPCIIHRGPVGAWCGYVAVPPGHPWHGKEMFDDALDARAHGGVTYTNTCSGEVCHVAKPGEPDDVWWIGFDCAHSGDLSPSDTRLYGFSYGVYRDQRYVTEQTKDLAEQARLKGSDSDSSGSVA